MDITKPSYFGPEIGVRSQEPDRWSMVPADAMPQARSKIRLPGLYRGWMTIYLRVPVPVGGMVFVDGGLTQPVPASIYPSR
jgi:hypothetical protein